MVPEVLVTNAEPPPGLAKDETMLLVDELAPPFAAPLTAFGATTLKAPAAVEVAPATAVAPPKAAPLPVVVDWLLVVPVEVAVPPAEASPELTPKTLRPEPAASAVAADPEDALLMLSAVPVPALEALELVSDDELVVVTVCAIAELLSCAEAIPASNTTAVAMRVFFMIFPSKSIFLGTAEHGSQV
jgi:hypothetical protein